MAFGFVGGIAGKRAFFVGVCVCVFFCIVGVGVGVGGFGGEAEW